MRYFRVLADILVYGNLENGNSGGEGVSGDGKFDAARRELIGDKLVLERSKRREVER